MNLAARLGNSGKKVQRNSVRVIAEYLSVIFLLWHDGSGVNDLVQSPHEAMILPNFRTVFDCCDQEVEFASENFHGIQGGSHVLRHARDLGIFVHCVSDIVDGDLLGVRRGKSELDWHKLSLLFARGALFLHLLAFVNEERQTLLVLSLCA